MTKKNIVFVINSLGRGGAEKALVTILRKINYSKYSVKLIVIRDVGGYIDEIPEQVDTIVIIKNYKNKFVNRLIWSISSRVIKYMPMIMYKYFKLKSQGIEKDALLIAFLEGPSTKIVSYFKNKKISWMHTDYNRNHWVAPFYKSSKEELSAYNEFNEIIFVSEQGRQSFVDFFDNKVTANTDVIYNPIDTKEIKSKAADFDSNFLNWQNKTEGTIRLVSVARFNPVKQLEWLVNLQSEFETKEINSSMTIIGEGDQFEFLKSIIEQKQIHNVFLVGFKSNPYNYMGASHIYLSPSKAESYPLSIAEAFTLGLPVVATTNSGSIELSRNGKFALLTDMNEESFQNKVKTLLIADEYNKFKTLSIEASNLFSIEDVMEKIEAVFDKEIS